MTQIAASFINIIIINMVIHAHAHAHAHVHVNYMYMYIIGKSLEINRTAVCSTTKHLLKNVVLSDCSNPLYSNYPVCNEYSDVI